MMADAAVCDQCNAEINPGSGYLFYSAACCDTTTPGDIGETGNVLLCDECTRQICSPEGFAKGMPEDSGGGHRNLLARLLDPMTMIRFVKEANAASIVQRAKKHEFSPEQAAARARELAELWWEDRGKAEAESAAFWK